MGYVISPPTAATHTTPRRCAPGMVVLATVIAERWPDLLVNVGAYGCFNRRPITGGTAKSLHGDGRALDVGVGWTPNSLQMQQMAELMWAATAGAYVLGVQRMLWNRHAWDAARGWRHSSSMGGPHLDHAHVELCAAAAWSRPLTFTAARCALG